jgi:hypothetical protein
MEAEATVTLKIFTFYKQKFIFHDTHYQNQMTCNGLSLSQWLARNTFTYLIIIISSKMKENNFR